MTHHPSPGQGIISSPGKRNESSSVRMPFVFSFLWSPLVKVDLSHPETFIFSAGVALAAARLTCFDLVIEGAGEQCGTKLCEDAAESKQ